MSAHDEAVVTKNRAVKQVTFSAIMQTVQLNKQQLDKLNKLRKLAGIEAITLEQQDTCC